MSRPSNVVGRSKFVTAILTPCKFPYGFLLAPILNQAYKDGRRQIPIITRMAAILRPNLLISRFKILFDFFINDPSNAVERLTYDCHFNLCILLF